MVSAQMGYWLNLCDEDLLTAKWLLDGQRLLHMAFFCHQIAEKALKAVIASEYSKKRRGFCVG